ncbi:hypothetical protein CTAYLR_005589 [Chrysophaeum taylorii]|uniref:G-protein coupled receptors family 3 profile domain-containing protein n=1 Tax=Chrysophaeum taylorii TaxID=2483200 RepID=A0AAD7U6E0_9STRA|nr:hypothetical protein CTAYLR_005589 [Chrysophaeum taylorii]
MGGWEAVMMVVMGALRQGGVRSEEVIRIRGVGASWPGDLYREAAYAYNVASENADRAHVAYEASTSADGQEELAENGLGAPDFAGSDVGCIDDCEELLFFPAVAGAVVPAYNLPSLNRTLVVDRESLAQIFRGEVRAWNYEGLGVTSREDAVPEDHNRKIRSLLPDAEIHVVVRADGSFPDTTTNAFASALTAFEQTFGISHGSGRNQDGVSWCGWNNPEATEVGVTVDLVDGGKMMSCGSWNYTLVGSNADVMAVVEALPSSIGYVEYDSIKALPTAPTNLKIADMVNRWGHVLTPSTNSIEFAMMEYGDSFDENNIVALVDAKGPDAWPISSYTYFVLHELPLNITCEARQVMLDFIAFFYDRASGTLPEAAGFAPLPDFLSTVFLDQMKEKIRCYERTGFATYAAAAEASNETGTQELLVPLTAYDVMRSYTDSYTVAEDLEFAEWPLVQAEDSMDVKEQRSRAAFAVTSFDDANTHWYDDEWVDDFYMAPLYVYGVAVVYRLDALDDLLDGSLVLNANVLAQIYLGNITRWDDEAIAGLNPDVALPKNAEIRVVSRSQPSDDVSLVKRLLGSANEEFRRVYGDITTELIARDPPTTTTPDDDDDVDDVDEELYADDLSDDDDDDDDVASPPEDENRSTYNVTRRMAAAAAAAAENETETPASLGAPLRFDAADPYGVEAVVRFYDQTIGFLPYSDDLELTVARMVSPRGGIVNLTRSSLAACVSGELPEALAEEDEEELLASSFDLSRVLRTNDDDDDDDGFRATQVPTPLGGGGGVFSTDDVAGDDGSGDDDAENSGLDDECWPLTATYDVSIKKNLVTKICEGSVSGSSSTVPERRLVEFTRWILSGGRVDAALAPRGLVPVNGTIRESLRHMLEEQIRCLDADSPPEKRRDNLSIGVKGVIVALVASVVALAWACAVWTWTYRDRLIVRLSQPGYLAILCLGCATSTSSAMSPFLGANTFSCQWQLFLYGAGFSIISGALVTKMYCMEKSISTSLKFRTAQPEKTRRDLLKDAARVMGAMSVGEMAILAAWALSKDPLHFERSCVDYYRSDGEKECVEVVGKCRSSLAGPFLGALFSYHMLCLGAGIFMCYRVRNIPSIIAEGKWVFTAVYSQIQLLVIALPLLALVEKDYTAFTVLKTALICACDTTVLLMIFVPKMQLVLKYGDFDRDKIVQYINSMVHHSTQNDHVYHGLRKSDDSDRSLNRSSSSNLRRSRSDDASSYYLNRGDSSLCTTTATTTLRPTTSFVSLRLPGLPSASRSFRCRRSSGSGLTGLSDDDDDGLPRQSSVVDLEAEPRAEETEDVPPPPDDDAKSSLFRITYSTRTSTDSTQHLDGADDSPGRPPAHNDQRLSNATVDVDREETKTPPSSRGSGNQRS